MIRLFVLLLQLNYGYRTYTNPRYRYIRWVERPATTEKTPMYRGNGRPSYRYPSNYIPHQHRSRDLSFSSYARQEDHLKSDPVKIETNFQDISDQISAAVRTNACPSDVPIDILFLLDSSYMTSSTAYSQFKRLVAYMASTMMYSDSMVKMAVFQFDEAQTERFISFHDYEEFSAFKASLSSMKRKQVGRIGRHTSRRPRRFSGSLRRRYQRNSSRMHQDPFENALDNVKKYGYSRSRGARAQAVKILVVMSGETPTYASNALATKLRSFHDINIFAVAVGERAGMTGEFTGSEARILRVFKENRLLDDLAQLQQLVCRDFEKCSTSSFQCLKKYNTGGYGGSYITKCHRINCDNGKCLTRPCHPSQFCKEKGTYDFECTTSSQNQLTCDDISCANGVCRMLGQTAQCQCHAGWTGDKCDEDIDECLIASHNCQHECINTSGGYKCECNKGYLLTVAGQCQDIDECGNSKHGCDQICRNYPGEYRCECYPGFSLQSDGHTCSEIDTCKLAGCSDKCVNLSGLAYRCQCSEGFILDNDDHTCIDANECALEPCENGYECINTSGSYECVDIDVCTQAHCSDGFSCKSFKGDFKCYDINECEASPCNKNENCENTVGGFVCSVVDPCAENLCEEGYVCRANEAGFECVDIDECENKNICPEGYRCENYEGDYECVDIDECQEYSPCDEIYTCKNTNGAYKCIFVDPCEASPCAEGLNCAMTVTGSYVCIDIDECLNEPCENHEECTNLHGGYRCDAIDECKSHPCASGFKCVNLNPAYDCIDIDECKEGMLNTCTERQACQNTEGSFKCVDLDPCEDIQCDTGFECVDYLHGFECLDIDECAIDSPCELGFSCRNTPGSFICEDFNECDVFGEVNICDIGFACVNNIGNFSCVDVDECLEIGSCPVGFECLNRHGSYDCLDKNECFDEPCEEGYACLNNEGSYTCVDVNECNVDSCPPGTNCVNTLGSYECTDVDECEDSPCDKGFYCSNSFGSFDCHDVDECSSLAPPCDEFSKCINTQGSFTCEKIKKSQMAETARETVNTCEDIKHKCSHACILLSTNNITIAPSTPIHIAGPNIYYRCDCPNGFELAQDGHTCVDIDECTIRKGGCSDYCFNSQGSYSCVCGEGKELSSDMHTCKSLLRNNDDSRCIVRCANGRCIDDVCTCADGWSGAHCDQDIDECSKSPCNHGTCLNTKGGFMCQCEKGFQFDSKRKNCVDVNECLSRKRNRCEQNCINEEGTYSCSCNENFELSSDGIRCRPTPEGICSQNPCHNSGKCVIDEHSFHCECEKGFTGRLCHHHIQLELPDYLNIHSEDQKVKIGDRSCNPNPCLNGGKCFAFQKMDQGQFVCACSQHFTGNKCQNEITACKGGCLNGGKCVESNEEPERNECQCTDRYYGRSCSKLRSVPNVCRDQAFDLVFLIDGSIRIGRKNYNMVIDWVKSLVAELNISQERSRVGLVQFSTKTEIEFDLARFNDKSNLIQGLEQSKSRFKNMGYNAYAGLRNSIDLFHGNNSRFLIMITAGRLYIHPRRLKEVLNAAAHNNVEILAVKLGKMSNEAELMGLTKNDRNIYGIRHKSDFRKEGAAILTSVCFKDDWRSKIIED